MIIFNKIYFVFLQSNNFHIYEGFNTRNVFYSIYSFIH